MKVNIQLLEIPSPERSEMRTSQLISGRMSEIVPNEWEIKPFLVTCLLESQFPAILQRLGRPEEGDRSMSVSQVNALIHICVCVCSDREDRSRSNLLKSLFTQIPQWPDNGMTDSRGWKWCENIHEKDESNQKKVQGATAKKSTIMIFVNTWFLRSPLILL